MMNTALIQAVLRERFGPVDDQDVSYHGNFSNLESGSTGSGSTVSRNVSSRYMERRHWSATGSINAHYALRSITLGDGQ
jgi:hypothetical protein